MNQITLSLGDIFSRPADSNYNSMQELLDVAEQERNESRTVKVEGVDILFSDADGQIFLNIPGQSPLPLTNYSMTQVAAMAKVPTVVLERLHAKERDDLVVGNLNTLFPNERSKTKFVLVRDHYEGDGNIHSVARAVNGGAYSRLWDVEVFTELEDFLMPKGFTPNLPHLMSGCMRNGFMHNLSTGLFRGDQCSFGFFFSENDSDISTAHLGGIKPGMVVWNSEVGARSFGFHTFYYHEKSGNIIVWTPSNHKRKRFVHRGDITRAFHEYRNVLEDTARNFRAQFIESVQNFDTALYTPFAIDEDAAVQRLQKQYKMSAANAKSAVRASKLPQHAYGADFNVWRIALGIAHEAGQTGRAESLVDNTMVATKMMRSILKV